MFNKPYYRHHSRGDLLARVRETPDNGPLAIIVLSLTIGLLFATGILTTNTSIPLVERAPDWLPWLFLGVPVAMSGYYVGATIRAVRKALRQENYDMYVDSLESHARKLEGATFVKVNYLLNEIIPSPGMFASQWNNLVAEAELQRNVIRSLATGSSYASDFKEITKWNVRDSRRADLREKLDDKVISLGAEADVIQEKISTFYRTLKTRINLDDKPHLAEVPRTRGIDIT